MLQHSSLVSLRSTTFSASKVPNPLPSSVSSNISKAIFRLLREEEEIDDQYGSAFSDTRHLPRMDGESLAEREFRIIIAQQICGLIRGYQECLFFVSASHPVFNRDRFLRLAPALFEGRKGGISAALSADYAGATSASTRFGTPVGTSQRLISPRAKRFLSGLVNTQLFHALLENLGSNELTFFHEVMDTFEVQGEQGKTEMQSSLTFGSSVLKAAAEKLSRSLDTLEDSVPTYHVHRHLGIREMSLESLDTEDYDFGYIDNETLFSSFTSHLFEVVKSNSAASYQKEGQQTGTHVSLQQLVEQRKNPWKYCKMFDINLSEDGDNEYGTIFWRKIHLKEALGEMKFR